MPPLLRSELPVRFKTRHHPIVWFHRTSRITVVAFGVVVLAMLLFASWIWALLLAVAELLALLGWRIHTWSAEWIYLTGKRIIRVQGVPETTSSEASLRLDRVSGARLVQSVPGKLFGYGDILLEAPGEHPDVKKLVQLSGATELYAILRELLFGEPHLPDPDESIQDHDTEPLPAVVEADQPPGRR